MKRYVPAIVYSENSHPDHVPLYQDVDILASDEILELNTWRRPDFREKFLGRLFYFNEQKYFLGSNMGLTGREVYADGNTYIVGAIYTVDSIDSDNVYYLHYVGRGALRLK